MNSAADLNVFLNPKSVAVIGASERQGSWGSFIMKGILSADYKGIIYPVNKNAGQIFGLPCFKDIRDIKESIDLAVVAIPDKYLEETVKICGEKKIKGITIITAGYAETSDKGGEAQEALTRLARSLDIRLLGPNVSGTFNLFSGFHAASSHSKALHAAPISGICQGGYAIHDLMAAGAYRKMGFGKFIHTGNEADLTAVDFLELFEKDPETQAIVMYLETIRDGKRFMKVAKRVSRSKPVIVYKGGRTEDSARAAQSHTGAMASDWQITKGMFKQAGIVNAPAMELMLPLAHSLVERPPMKGRRVGIITMGGSWGVALTDCLVESGLAVPEFSDSLQKKFRDLGLPSRASAKNPVDYGASGKFTETEFLLSMGREIMQSNEVDALVMHGFGQAGMDLNGEEDLRLTREIEINQVKYFSDLEKETGLPVFIGNHHGLWESKTVSELNKQGIRVYTRLHDIALILKAMADYWSKRLV